GLMDKFRGHGMRVIDPYSAIASDKPYVTKTFFTHPKDTFGQLEFQTVDGYLESLDAMHSDGGGNGLRDPRLIPEFSSSFWRDEHPLGNRVHVAHHDHRVRPRPCAPVLRGRTRRSGVPRGIDRGSPQCLRDGRDRHRGGASPTPLRGEPVGGGHGEAR